MPTYALHHSRLLRYRSPQGAVPAGSAVTLRLLLSARCADAAVSLRLWRDGREQQIRMRGEAAEDGVLFEAEAQTPEEPGLLWYYFLVTPPEGKTLYYGGESGEGALMAHEPPGYQITVYDPAFMTPRAFREGIVYQIFPDRFRRSAAPSAEQPGAAYHKALGRTLRIQPDWYAQPAYLPAPGQDTYMPNDFFLGDLDGIRQALPYLKSLHVTTLYLNPVFESASNHRYDTADYKRADPILGGDGALAALCEAAAAEGMRVMLDGVFSHTGADSVYFNKYGRYPEPGAYHDEGSPFRKWYDFRPSYPHGYRCWWGFPELPEVDENDPDYAAFIMGKGGVLEKWAGLGVTSWRLDVADELPEGFIKALRTALKGLDPEGVLLGEVWEDASNKIAYGVQREYAGGRSLDCVMNYPFRAAVADFLLMRGDAGLLNHRLQTLREHYPKPFYYAALNLLSSHDTVRALTVLGGAPDRDALTREAQAAFTLSPEAFALGRARLLIAAAIQMALPGVPSIYYGDEAGMCGMADPFNRAGYPWGREDAGLLSSYRALTAARGESPALRAGFCRMGALSPDVFAALRYTAGGRDAFGETAPESAALLLCNRSRAAQSAAFSAGMLPEGPDADVFVSVAGRWRDALSGRGVLCGETLQVALPPLCAMLLLRKER